MRKGKFNSFENTQSERGNALGADFYSLGQCARSCYIHGRSMQRKTARIPGTVGSTTLLIGTMSLALVLGLGSMNFWDQPNEEITMWTSRLGEGMREVPAGGVLVFAAVMAYLTVFLILSSPGLWRKWVIWLSLMLLAMGWIPVLALASWKLAPCMPIAAGLWSGICAFVYAKRHELPCEKQHSLPGVELKSVREVLVADQSPKQENG
jgi:hypothetical protein